MRSKQRICRRQVEQGGWGREKAATRPWEDFYRTLEQIGEEQQHSRNDEVAGRLLRAAKKSKGAQRDGKEKVGDIREMINQLEQRAIIFTHGCSYIRIPFQQYSQP